MFTKPVLIACIACLSSGLISLPAQAGQGIASEPKSQSVQRPVPKMSLEQQKRFLQQYMNRTIVPQNIAYRGEKELLSNKVLQVKELPESFVRTFIDMRYYQGKTYILSYAAIDFKVKRESHYRLNGINYRFVIFVRERGEWMVDKDGYMIAPVHRIVEQNLGFGTEDERQMAEIMRKREQGIYLNRKGERIEEVPNVAEAEELRQEVTIPPAVAGMSVPPVIPPTINPYYKRPSYVRVRMTLPSNRKHFGCATGKTCIRRIEFLDYVKHVLPREWRLNAPDEALKTGAMAVKMHAWYNVAVNPKLHIGNADVYDTTQNQKYLADLSDLTKTPEGKARVQHLQSMFHAPGIAGVGFKESKRDNLVDVEYRDQVSGGQHSGYISQLGSEELARQGKSYADIIKYYLEASPRIERSPLDFFRYAK